MLPGSLVRNDPTITIGVERTDPYVVVFATTRVQSTPAVGATLRASLIMQDFSEPAKGTETKVKRQRRRAIHCVIHDCVPSNVASMNSCL